LREVIEVVILLIEQESKQLFVLQNREANKQNIFLLNGEVFKKEEAAINLPQKRIVSFLTVPSAISHL
jgi:hypothetical protein